MKSRIIYHLPFLMVWGILTAYSLWGIRIVPFHPDESTNIFMSTDLDDLLKNPLLLTWNPVKEDYRQVYRLLDAPITRYIIGSARLLFNQHPIVSDWDWSKTWMQNIDNGAMPNEELLRVSRLAITLLLPLTLVLQYFIGNQLGGRLTGIISAAILGTNALILLHNRRAMHEGALTLGVVLTLWGFLQGYKRPWLAGLGLAIAANSKISSIALLPVGLISIWWLPRTTTQLPRKRLLNTTQFLSVLLILTFLLNPILWINPFTVAINSWEARQKLLRRQVQSTFEINPELVLNTPTTRSAILLGNLFIRQPSFAELGNYAIESQVAENVYLSIPGHNLLRGFIWGGVMLLLTSFGFVLAVINLRKSDFNYRRTTVILVLASVTQTLALLITIPLPYQRYVLPLIPLVSLWAAYGICKFTSQMTGIHTHIN